MRTALSGGASNPSSRQPLAVHIRVVYMSLYCSTACSLLFCSQWPACPFNTYLRLHISSFNYWLTGRQYWTLHYRSSPKTWYHSPSLSGQSDMHCLGQQRSVTLNLSGSGWPSPARSSYSRGSDLGRLLASRIDPVVYVKATLITNSRVSKGQLGTNGCVCDWREHREKSVARFLAYENDSDNWETWFTLKVLSHLRIVSNRFLNNFTIYEAQLTTVTFKPSRKKSVCQCCEFAWPT